MKPMFANLTPADFRRRSPKELRAVARRRVHVLFDEIQVAIHNDDRTKITRQSIISMACLWIMQPRVAPQYWFAGSERFRIMRKSYKWR